MIHESTDKQPIFKKAKEHLLFNQLQASKNNKIIMINHDSILNALLNELMPISFEEKAQLQEKELLSTKHYIVISIQEILEVARQRHWSLCINGGQVFLYNGHFWKALSKDELHGFLGKAAEKLGVPKFDAKYHRFKTDLVKQFISTAYLPRPTKNTNEVLINMAEGTFIITPTSQFIRGFDRNDFLTYQLPFSYAEDAKAPLFEKYLNRVLPEVEQQKILSEFIGYVFIKHLKLEKALVLYGGGANGKSVFFEIITSLLGKSNVSNYSLQSLTDKSGYYRADLPNKLLNYASEISPHMDSTLFKQLISGEPIEARLPYSNPFIADDYAKFIFNTNELPKDVEQNEAFFRRFLILYFGVTIPEEERDPELAKNIVEFELPGVFNWVLEGLHRILKQKGFTHSTTVQKMVKEYRQQSDSVQLFIVEEGYIPDIQNELSLKNMYAKYREFCLDSGYKSTSTKVFSERLKNAGYTVTRKSKGMVVDAVKKPFTNPTLATDGS